MSEKTEIGECGRARRLENQRFGQERALYNETDLEVVRCRFEGPEDGESALKECLGIVASGCDFNLRYPLWHTREFELADCRMGVGCRAPLWYASKGVVRSSEILGVKCLRECDDVSFENCRVVSEEFGWRCRNVRLADSSFESVYFLFEARNVTLQNVNFKGKYSFQYVEGGKIEGCRLDTKDAFWHSRDVVVKDSVVKGEYLGWYSENLTLVRCHISGTQPLCYCKNLRLIDCTMEGCDLAFEYSDVDAAIKGSVKSVKNPASGRIVADSIGELVLEGSKLKSGCEVMLADGKKLL